MTQVHFMSCLKSRPIEVVSGGWVYESADGTMVVGKSCSAGVEPEPPSDALVEVSVLPLLELSEPVCAGDAALEVLLGAILRDWVLAYQYGLVVAVDEADEDAESSDDADDEEDWGSALDADPESDCEAVAVPVAVGTEAESCVVELGPSVTVAVAVGLSDTVEEPEPAP
jgi:hypothetical protein